MIQRTLLFAMIAPIALGACSRSAEIRYRVSYTVDDNGVSRSASGVWSVTVRRVAVPLVSKYKSEFQGEAIPLQLPGRGVLLMLPMGEQGSDGDAVNLVAQLFRHRASARQEDGVRMATDIAEMVGQSRSIRCARYGIAQPQLELGETTGDLCMSFAFIAVPASQTMFRRATLERGRFVDVAGVRLRDAHVTITRDPVTRGIEHFLPWLPAAQAHWNSRLITDNDRAKYAYEIIYMKQ